MAEQRVGREQRLVFGEDPCGYDAGRPPYPEVLFDELTARCEGPGRVLDIGCGTGKATVPLAARGWVGTALDPDPAMAGLARAALGGFPGWRIEVGTFEEFAGGTSSSARGAPAAGEGPYDLVTCAQAWHWLDPERRLGHAAALLGPGGTLALWWNRVPADGNDLRAVLEEVYAMHAPALRAREPGGKGAAPEPPWPVGVELTEVERRCYPWMVVLDAEGYVALLDSQSDHRLLAPGVRAVLYGGLAAAIEAGGGRVTLRFETDLWSARVAL